MSNSITNKTYGAYYVIIGGWVIVAIGSLLVSVSSLSNTYFQLAELYQLYQTAHPTLGTLFLWVERGIRFSPILFYLFGIFLFWQRTNNLTALGASLLCLTATPSLEFYALPAEYKWLVNIVILANQFGLLLFLFTFPTGSFHSFWTKLLTTLLIGRSLFSIVISGSLLNADLALIRFAENVLIILIGIGVQYYSYRKATPLVRQQVKWVLYSTGVWAWGAFIVSLFAILFPQILGNYHPFLPLDELPTSLTTTGLIYRNLSALFLILTSLSLLVALMFSILRYRLWDIDFVINRSLVYGSLTFILVLIFGVTLLILWQLLRDFETGSLIALVISSVLFGMIFQPTRQKLQRFVDQRFYNIQINYQRKPLSLEQDVASIIAETEFSKYEDLELIGTGGMGQVYKAIHPTLKQAVAIKLLSAQAASNQTFRQRFQREAKIIAQLQHPNIVQLYDFGEEQGTPYIVMKYIAGIDLKDYLQTHARLSYAQAFPFIQDIALALEYAHQLGIVHRDIKPSNIMLQNSDESYHAILMDFGLAKKVNSKTALTGSGVLGTFQYMAPEQIQGQKQIDHRTDLYAFGVLIYQMLTGELPFKQHNIGALLIAHLTQPPPDPQSLAPDLPASVIACLMGLLEKDPHDRYSSARAFLDALPTPTKV